MYKKATPMSGFFMLNIKINSYLYAPSSEVKVIIASLLTYEYKYRFLEQVCQELIARLLYEDLMDFDSSLITGSWIANFDNIFTMAYNQCN